MKCEEASRFLSPYLDSELDPKTSFEISGHCDHCPMCRERFEAEQRIERSLAAELKKNEPKDEEIWRRARSRVAHPRSTRSRSWAVGLLGLILGTMALVAFFHHRAPAGLAGDLRSQYLTTLSGRAALQITTSDGKEIESFCKERLGLAFTIPSKIGRFALTGARLCTLRGATAVQFAYKAEGDDLSVFIFSADHLDRFPASDQLTHPGLDETADPRVAACRSGWKVVGAVGSLRPEELSAACHAFDE
jgi:anti-sigma factor RsiW